MTRRRYIAAGTAVLVIVPIGLWGFLYFAHHATGFDRHFDRQFHVVESGMKRTEVIRLLGDPVGESREFRLGQYAGFEGDYAAAKASGATHYLSWGNGIDVVYCVGFDDTDRVVHLAYGGT